MKYKIVLLIIICAILLVGCSKKEENLELVCKMSTTTITLTIEDGKIIKYVDQIQGEFSKEEIEILNETYLKEITNNSDAITKMREVIASNGGECN